MTEKESQTLVFPSVLPSYRTCKHSRSLALKQHSEVSFLQAKENTGEEKDYQGKIWEGVGAAASSWRSDGTCQPAGWGEGRRPAVWVTALRPLQTQLRFSSVCRFGMCGYLFWHNNFPGYRIKDALWDHFSCLEFSNHLSQLNEIAQHAQQLTSFPLWESHDSISGVSLVPANIYGLSQLLRAAFVPTHLQTLALLSVSSQPLLCYCGLLSSTSIFLCTISLPVMEAVLPISMWLTNRVKWLKKHVVSFSFY